LAERAEPQVHEGAHPPARVRAGVVLRASLRRALLEETAEITPIALYVVSLAVGLLSQAFFARLVDAVPNAALGAYQGHFGAFILIGVAVFDLQQATVGGLAKAVRAAQLSGSFESMLATPTPTGLVLFAMMLPSSLMAIGRVLLFVGVGRFLFGLSFSTINALGVAAVLVASIGAFLGFGLIAAALTMVLRRSDPLSRLIASMSAVAGGVFYPTTVLPRWLAVAGQALPIAPALEGLRAAMLRGAGPGALASPLLRLGFVAVVVAPLGAWFFGRMVARARGDGSMTAW
jgi:ABC-2 type transport system permease protein